MTSNRYATPEPAPSQVAIENDDDRRYAAIVKGDQHYLFVFHRQRVSEVLRILGRFAADPDLNFTWADAANVSLQIRELAKGEVP